MNIAIFTNNYLPNPYGVTGSVESFRKEFEKRGHTVFIFAPHWEGYADKNPNVFRYPSFDIEIKMRFPLAIPFSWKIDRILKKLNLDVIHSQHPNLLGSAARRWARKKKIPLVFTWHTLYDHYAHFAKYVPESVAAGYMVQKAVRYANQSDAVIVPTASVIPVIRKWGVKNPDVIPIPTGVDEDELAGADGGMIRAKFGIGKDEIVIVTITRFTQEKNIEFLFRSVAKALAENRKLRFLVGGEGYLEPGLRDFVKKNGLEGRVIFAGFVPNNEKKHLYAAADIFAIASLSETQGMVLSEAMYMGLPAVAVDSTGSKNLVLNNASGFLVSQDESKFSRAVLELANDHAKRKKFADNSLYIARGQLTGKVCAEKMLKIYEESISRRKK